MTGNPPANRTFEVVLFTTLTGTIACIVVYAAFAWYVSLKPEMPVPENAQEILQKPFISGPNHRSYKVNYTFHDDPNALIVFYLSQGAECKANTCRGSTFLNRGTYDLAWEYTGGTTNVEGIVTWNTP